MCLLSFFLACTSSYNLTNRDIPYLFSDMEHKPFFAILYSDWCPHCLEHNELFMQLEKKYDGDSRFGLVRINCDNFNHICKKFPDSFTPGLYWVIDSPDRAEGYFGTLDLPSIISFIEKHLGELIVEVQNISQYENLLTTYKDNSIFVYQKAKDHGDSDKISDIVFKFKNYPTIFANLKFTLKEDTEDSLFFNINPSTNISTIYDGPYETELLKIFINKYAFPPISPLSALFFEHAITNNYNVLLLADEEPYFVDNFTRIVTENKLEMRAIHFRCVSFPKFCLDLLIQTGNGPQIIINNPKKHYEWYYKDELESSQIINWINEVQSGKRRAAGPGGGFIGFITNLYDDFHRKGPVALILFLSIFAVLAAIFLLGTVQSIVERRRLHYHKLE
ncbi:hypothetical protein TVAG_114230 [Trichomonas vaginalis G3]|uniref:Thioredoxin domain-containing protein n=1 Tax=Trichomonas vaginalis (strain ATCC PRA-98 / G3) TaxID=412133 RepID=A2F3V0_TRIV3|nr:disulfide-isomerase C17h9.14C-related family [Trichomonas vaginalis G3]EAY00419.1 hypothetical protein TVAG_114230 [Trichomonas vaginalis G3]KAI5526560.1 disulfide-isomerase C17h9.14C-related family [Trichomonas vaginalis G3]|eukprot:XP_001313348.1 hypothetical protein [Trichomonas vaginalis G3]